MRKLTTVFITLMLLALASWTIGAKSVSKSGAHELTEVTPPGAKLRLYIDLSQKDFLPGLKKLVTGWKLPALADKQKSEFLNDILNTLKDLFKDIKRIKILSYEMQEKATDQTIMAAYNQKLTSEKWRLVLKILADPQNTLRIYVRGNQEGIFGIYLGKTENLTICELEGFFDLSNLLPLVNKFIGRFGIPTAPKAPEKPEEQK